MKFYGRDQEIAALTNELRLAETSSRLAVITGRRRVGKTKLILKVAEESGWPMLYFLCRRRYAEEELAQIWLDDVRETFGLDEEDGPRRLKLAEVVRFVMKLSREKPCVLILDECQELDYVAPSFWADLQGVWDREKDNSRLLLMMSGSIAAAIRHIFDDASEPLFGRQDLALTLRPFGPKLLKEIFLDLRPQGTPEDLLTFYAVTGGVARYVACLADTVPLTQNDMVNLIFSESGYFLRTDGATLLANELRVESAIYERILRAVARGSATWNEIADQLGGKNIAGYMDRLEKQYGLIRKYSPMFSESSRGVRYGIADPYFRFWFRFIEPVQYQSLAARGNWEALRAICLDALNQYTGRTLEDWYHDLFGASPKWTRTGRWWDRRGENEIDLIALNDLTGKAVIAEIKRNADKIDMRVLAGKAAAFEKAEGRNLKKYDRPELLGLSLSNLLEEHPAQE